MVGFANTNYFRGINQKFLTDKSRNCSSEGSGIDCSKDIQSNKRSDSSMDCMQDKYLEISGSQ